MDLTEAATDTISELCAVISSFANYKAFYVGDGTIPSVDLSAFPNTQIKNTLKILSIQNAPATSGKQHILIPSFTKPSFSIIADRIGSIVRSK